jgi:hypothetical protein
MSRVLRRPMFRGGIADSEGTGITSGLMESRQGYANGPTDEGVQQDEYSPLIQDILGLKDFLKLKGATAVDTLFNVPINKASEYITGYNPGLSAVRQMQAKGDPTFAKYDPDKAYFFNTPTEARKGTIRQNIEYKKEKEKKPVVPPAAPPPQSPEEVSKKQDFKTIYEDLLPIFRASVGPDQDEYTRQKYLELAKFGLNLLKPTPAGIKPSLLSSAAAAAERPLEGYGAILERERQAAKVPEALALQQAMKLSEPGTVGKAIRDLIQTGAAKNEKEALNIYLKGDSAAQRKQAMDEKTLLASRLQGYQALAGVKDQAIIDQLTDLVFEDPSLAYKIKGERSKYKPEAYEEGAIYIDKGKIVKYKKGLFYTPNEPGFKG